MNLSFQSPEFEDAVAAVCHGSATAAEMRALNELLRSNPTARDEYLFQVELHSRLGSDPDLFPQCREAAASLSLPGMHAGDREKILPLNPVEPPRQGRLGRVLVMAACLVLIAGGVGTFWLKGAATRRGARPITHWNRLS